MVDLYLCIFHSSAAQTWSKKAKQNKQKKQLKNNPNPSNTSPPLPQLPKPGTQNNQPKKTFLKVIENSEARKKKKERNNKQWIQVFSDIWYTHGFRNL